MTTFNSTTFFPSSRSFSSSIPQSTFSSIAHNALKQFRRSSPWPTSSASAPTNARRPWSDRLSSAASSISEAMDGFRWRVARSIAPSSIYRTSNVPSSVASSGNDSEQYAHSGPHSIQFHKHNHYHAPSAPLERSSDSSDLTPIGNRRALRNSPIYTLGSRSAITYTPPPSPVRYNHTPPPSPVRKPYFSNFFPAEKAASDPPPSTAAASGTNFKGPGRTLRSCTPGPGFRGRLTYWNGGKNPPDSWDSEQRSLCYTPQSASGLRSGYSGSSNTKYNANNSPWRSRNYPYSAPTSGYNRPNFFRQPFKPKEILRNHSAQSTGEMNRSVSFAADASTGTGVSASDSSELARGVGDMISEALSSSNMESLNPHNGSLTTNSRVSTEGSQISIVVNNHFGRPAMIGNAEAKIQHGFFRKHETGLWGAT